MRDHSAVSNRGVFFSRRKFYRRKHAVHVIGVAFRHYKLRKYLQKVVDTFSGVKRMKDYGKNLTWPSPPPAIEEFVESLKRMHRRWVWRILEPLPLPRSSPA